MLNNLNCIEELPRQNYKTQSVCCFIVWIYDYVTKNSEIAFLHKKFDDSKMNLDRVKKIREGLPKYLRNLGKGDTNNLTEIRNKRGNKILAKNAAVSEEQADLLGRGSSQPIQWLIYSYCKNSYIAGKEFCMF